MAHLILELTACRGRVLVSSKGGTRQWPSEPRSIRRVRTMKPCNVLAAAG